MRLNLGFKREDYKLCYVDGPWAYFTTQDLKRQWGDDWNDAPYERNAGTPYGPCWHNQPTMLHHNHRGHVEPGKLCRCSCCVKDWNEDGTPKFGILKVAFTGDLETPDAHCTNSDYSVEMINRGAVAWLVSPSYSDKQVAIPAGTGLCEFQELVLEAGGMVYYPIVSYAK